MPSNLSKKPPCPGSKLPESLMRTRRFKYDSNKSPASANKHTINEKVIVNNHVLPIFISMSKKWKPIVAKIRPPAKPSHDLPGLIAGKIL